MFTKNTVIAATVFITTTLTLTACSSDDTTTPTEPTTHPTPTTTYSPSVSPSEPTSEPATDHTNSPSENPHDPLQDTEIPEDVKILEDSGNANAPDSQNNMFFETLNPDEYTVPQHYYEEGTFTAEALDALPQEALAVTEFLKDYSASAEGGEGLPVNTNFDLITSFLKDSFTSDGYAQFTQNWDTQNHDLLALFPGWLNKNDLTIDNDTTINTHSIWSYNYYNFKPGYTQKGDIVDSVNTLNVPTSINIQVSIPTTDNGSHEVDIWGNIYWYHDPDLGWIIDSYELAT